MIGTHFQDCGCLVRHMLQLQGEKLRDKAGGSCISQGGGAAVASEGRWEQQRVWVLGLAFF